MKSVTDKWAERERKIKEDVAKIRTKLTPTEWKKIREYFIEYADTGYRGPG